MDKKIKKVLNTLTNSGYEAYLVGGYVRDALMGKVSFDIDICTNALPKDIYNLFSISKNNYGSVNIKMDQYNIDITTFRKDLNYVNRHPSEVIYINSLKEDLVRRDFTINTICMDEEEKIIDLLNGVEDLNKRLIKMVGDPFKRLAEDPLRILRAIRFATVLDFDIEDNLYKAIIENARLVGNLSKARIREELDKILLSENYQKGLDLLKFTGIIDVIGISYDEINYVDDILGMWAQIKVQDMAFTNNEKSNIIKIAEVIKLGYIDYEILFKYGLYICSIAGKVLNIDYTKINELFNKMPIKARTDIDITAKEIESLVGSGKVIGETYNTLTNLILQGKLNNYKKDIIEFLKRK